LKNNYIFTLNIKKELIKYLMMNNNKNFSLKIIPRAEKLQFASRGFDKNSKIKLKNKILDDKLSVVF